MLARSSCITGHERLQGHYPIQGLVREERQQQLQRHLPTQLCRQTICSSHADPPPEAGGECLPGVTVDTLPRQRRLQWLGNVRRMEDGRIPKTILYVYSELPLGEENRRPPSPAI